MTTPTDIRWLQRLASYQKARQSLVGAVQLAATRPLSDLEKQGMIQAFEFVFELAWQVMKDYFLYQGNPERTGSRDAIRSAFKNGLITDGEGWMEMIKSRNQTSHTYNESVANEICGKILRSYHLLFEKFEADMKNRAD
ncbi:MULTISPECIES: nucleotidyltransferase substrate binding protein [unclassified Acidovorax]|uniref:nucleotidyltransferase substrate binding protein n=1 Tax=unclassified Acidovorax TaxID=2684926 RepID=UPI000BC573B0|nr:MULTISPECIES: nucleotidyltransferase substrate binding protein [unclassified Acidovorax]OZA54876.1 MAG: nucleotidyltransferase [Acidovorax sp. 17-64-282]HQS20970.1 nucleotidyltransferase substrate binding protein [Acidovorax defluvii]OYY86071.1 MAG: nucleotidyltransferase [Acidovorax sp. 28-64-14]OZA67356.1 MAG: nucleotidyltransferase [Acidovorax sp. 39-64-12]HQS64878.1 nucleotidyltransferase substrate binding protein [Acidovorax defluvii]